jgi:DnaJ domain
MASATRVRDWATVDYYALLGVESSADADAVTRAFREQAKRSHPDATDDAQAAARFSDVTAAYAVLGDRQTRREYDRVRAELRANIPSVAAPTAGPRPAPAAARKPWSLRRAWTVLVAGVLVTFLGVGVAALTWTMHAHDARQRARFVPVTASRIDVNGGAFVTFVTSTGRRIEVPEPHQHGDPNGLGPTVRIRYDPADPEHVIVNSGTIGRDITFTIVALKFLIGGPVFTVLGWRRRRGATRA